MTDRERADRIVAYDLAADLVDDADRQQIARGLAEEFGAVRLHERRTIAAHLRYRAQMPGRTRGGAICLEGAAIAIERGEHGS